MAPRFKIDRRVRSSAGMLAPTARRLASKTAAARKKEKHARRYRPANAACEMVIAHKCTAEEMRGRRQMPVPPPNGRHAGGKSRGPGMRLLCSARTARPEVVQAPAV